MLDGFNEQFVETDEARILVRTKGIGKPVVLIHGYPQTGVCWHRIAPVLAQQFRVIIPDLRGYGGSRGPAPDNAGTAYSKHAMARDIAAVLDALGEERASIVGHDRGARVSYRFALDHPDRTTHLVSLDVVPTGVMWRDLTAESAISAYHWQFLAQPKGLPEWMIAHDPDRYLVYTLESWVADPAAFSDEAMDAYKAAFRDPAMIAACCADYRAGAGIDWEMDAADMKAGRKIQCPILVLWGHRDGRDVGDALATWSEWGTVPAIGGPVRCGHFLPEEAPETVLEWLVPFLGR